MPEPLGSPKGRANKGEEDDKISNLESTVRARPIPRPFNVNRPVPPDDHKHLGPGQGYTISARFALPPAQMNVEHAGALVPTWPLLRIELLREFADQPAKMRVILESAIYGLPQGTELRLRADRLGTMIVWPDLRSYRLAAVGALGSIFADRRVDRLPYVPTVFKPLEPGSRLGKATRRTELSSGLGRAEFESTEMVDLPYTAPLLCHFLLDFLRIEPDMQTCPDGQLPLRLSVEWKDGGTFLFEVTSLSPKKDLELDLFRVPPPMPIFKGGELPPTINDYVLDEASRSAFIPLVETPLDEVSIALSSSLADGPPEATAPQRPSDEIELWNTTDRPLLVIIDRIPWMWLAPDQRKQARTKATTLRISAQDFWGQKYFDFPSVSAPSLLHLGPERPAQSSH